MNGSGEQQSYAQLVEELEALYETRDSAQFIAAVRQLQEFAENGCVDAAIFLGEILALPGPVYSPAEAYKWYYIGLSQSGYTVEYNDQNQTPPHYCGPVGDFRNESLVSELILTLGLNKIRELDGEAAAWLESQKSRQ